MSTVRVANCDSCYFRTSLICTHPETKPGTNVLEYYDVSEGEAPPDWCPLRQGPTTVELEPSP